LYPIAHHAGARSSSGPSSTHRARATSTALTYPTRSANADDGDVGAPGMVQQLDEYMYHDGDGRNAHTMLESIEKCQQLSTELYLCQHRSLSQLTKRAHACNPSIWEAKAGGL
jgi:hypothetical protein